MSNGGPEAGHPLGFTRQGCDVYSRVVWGARTSLSAWACSVVLITAALGIPMGALAGFYGGKVDSILSRIGDIFFSIPYFLAAIVVMSVLSAHRNVLTISFAIGGFAWASLARIVRAEVLADQEPRVRDGLHGGGQIEVLHAGGARAAQLADARHRDADH